jgi:hypothetical protein
MRVDPLYGAPKVGGDTLAWCGKCRLELTHVIVAMVSGKPARVQCKTCKAEHSYKRLGGTAEATQRRSARPASAEPKRTTIRASVYWEEKVAKLSAKVPRRYAVNERFEASDLVEHPTFGLGIVESVRKDGKIVVLFRDGEKTLIHGKA